MKFILVIMLSLFITNIAKAQDDRYFDSRKNYSSTHKKIKVVVKKHHKYVREYKTKKIRDAAPRYAGETYSPDPIQWVAKSIARVAGEVIGGRPSGCPRQFCGCGASLHLFGRIIPALNLAANWLRFPRAMAAAPGMVAARRGHVFVLKQHLHGNTWLSFDANSGGHKTRIHPRSIAGFIIVNPRG